MPFCPDCGRELSADARFCPYCGTPTPPHATAPHSLVKRTHASKNISIVVMLVVLVGAATLFYALKPKTDTQTSISLTPDKYVFIDHHTHIRGELIEGNYPRKMIDFPTYSFDQKSGILKGLMNFATNESLKTVYGSGLSLSGAAGGGAATGLSGVYRFPYEEEKFRILRVDDDGTAHIEYNSVSIVLKSGGEWTNTTSIIDTKQIGDQKGKANLTITDRIVNYGILDKSKILNTRARS